jgi:dihydropteroate synthase
MGILNVTPDSFSDKGLHFKAQDAIDAGVRMMDEGADLIDIGGESTRPGALPVPAADELARVMPVVESLAVRGIPISIDTRKAVVAKRAIEAGVCVVNDVTAFSEREMLTVCAESDVTVCLMHMQGMPNTMQANPIYDDVVADVLEYLTDRAQLAKVYGIPGDRIWLDPGIGFGKTPIHNLELLHNLGRFVDTGYAVLIGVSRKSSIGVVAGGAPVDQRLPGTLAAQVLAQASGVRIVRAHDVKEGRQAIDVAAAILRPASFSMPLA